MAAQARIPFCPLPDRLKTLIANGFRDGRSPDVLVVGSDLSGGTSAVASGVPWPSTTEAPSTTVAIVFTGPRVRNEPLPPGTGVDQIAPTLADLLAFKRAHPEIRSGKAVGVDAGGLTPGVPPRLILEIAWTGVGGDQLKQVPAGGIPWIRGQFRSGAGTFAGDVGSVPLDPAATLTTIGTGGLPYQHGIIGSLLRTLSGAVAPAWSKGAPTSIIATLPDDFDQANGQAPKIALIAPTAEDQGLIGGKWYVGHDKDLMEFGGDPIANVRAALATGMGSDATPDILGVVLQGSPRHMDEQSSVIQQLAERATGGPAGLVTVTAGTGERAGNNGSAAAVAALVDRTVGAPVVAATAPGGLFLDPSIQSASNISSQDVVAALVPPAGATPTTSPSLGIEDAFQGFAVSFRRYC